MNPFKRTINNGFGDSKLSLPRAGLLLYLGRPNLEAADVPIGDDTEIGDDTIIRWMFLLPADADIRAATGWVSGAGNIFYDAAGDPVAVLASEIAAWADINRYNVLFNLVSADTETGRLAIYALDADHTTLNKARRVLRESQYEHWAPLGAILHYDAEVAPLTELVGGVHTLNHSVLGPQYQRLADGSYINVGAQPAVDVLAGGIKGLRTCGAITNLLLGDTSIARAVTLTAQAYTLQVIGDGSVSCSYGTATVGSPLTFTATAGTTTFTPSGATLWILTATAYPTPYVPPGATQPASNGTATNGTWFANPDGSELWQALDGHPDGVELWTGAISSDAGWTSNGDGTFTGVNATGDVYKSSIIPSNSRAKFRYEIISRTAGSVSPKLNGTITTYVSTVGAYSTTLQDTVGFAKTGISGNAFSGTIRVISIQRIQPQPFTLATRIPMGVGSDDLPLGDTALALLSEKAESVNAVHGYATSATLGRAVSSRDGATTVTAPASGATWTRNAVIQRFTQVNAAGTRFRVGYMIEGTHTTIQWSHPSEDSTTWAVYDGSFNPSTLYRFMLGYNNPYPQWLNKMTGWKRQVPTTELEAWA